MEDIRIGRDKWARSTSVGLVVGNASTAAILVPVDGDRTRIRFAMSAIAQAPEVVWVGYGARLTANIVAVFTQYQRSADFDVVDYGQMVKEAWWGVSQVDVVTMDITEIILNKV